MPDNAAGGMPPRLVRFQLNDDTFLICFGEGEERPKGLTAKNGTGNTVVTYRRKK
jgi:hypothetical protein